MPKGPKPKPIEELFWPKVQRGTPDECWPWIAYIQRNGYAKFPHTSGTWQAHRLAYTLLVGTIPPGLTIDHLCRNTICCNPAHMELTTKSVNTTRELAVRYAGKTHCVQGHQRSEENTFIRKDGRRECRVCNRNRCLLAYERDRESRKAKMRAYYYSKRDPS